MMSMTVIRPDHRQQAIRGPTGRYFIPGCKTTRIPYDQGSGSLPQRAGFIPPAFLWHASRFHRGLRTSLGRKLVRSCGRDPSHLGSCFPREYRHHNPVAPRVQSCKCYFILLSYVRWLIIDTALPRFSNESMNGVALSETQLLPL